ncbi:MAG: hypothetical protein AAFO95_13865 [Cyanobacteria bacterium J06600_6]
MSYTSFIHVFNLFANCYVYVCISYISVLFVIHLYYSLFTDNNEYNLAVEVDFYKQVKELLNPPTGPVLETDFKSMTLRQLRTHIKENQLHQQIRESVGKTVSNACKKELIEALT